MSRNQFSVAHGILSQATEFANFRGISTFSRNSVLAGDKGTNTAYFGRFQAALDNCAVKYATATLALMGY